MSNEMKAIMESWKRSIQEAPPDILDDPERANVQANYKPHPYFTGIVKEIIPFANVLDIKPYYEELMITLNKGDASPNEIAIASIAFLHAVGSVLVDGHPVARMAKAGRKAAEVGFELVPKIVSAANKIETAPFKLAPKVRKDAKELRKKAEKLPFVLKSKARGERTASPFELKPKGFRRFDLKPKE